MAEATARQQTEASHGSPFHEGEQRIQAGLGVREEIEPWARQVIRGWLPDEHRDFYAQLPFVVVAARDDLGQPWVTLLAGEPGFARSDDPAELGIASAPAAGDPLHGALRPGADVGVLGIEPHTRRRNRVNGRVLAPSDRGFTLGVDQSFGNCPKFITERVARPVAPSPRASQARRTKRLGGTAQRWIETADTFFIASGFRGEGENVAFGMDASHRGGPAGFVRVLDDRTLVFEDYAGNNHYNTIGNLSVDPRAGLLFVDFAKGGLLHLRGTTRIVWEGERRLVRFAIDEVVERPHALPLRFTEPRGAQRRLRVAEIRDESAEVRSFWLEPADGHELEPFAAGQYLPISLALPGHDLPVERTYSLSSAPRGDRYRISVKRERGGLVSGHLHGRIAEGDVIETGEPSGTFVLDPRAERPAVLVSAGVGVTPMVSMLHALAQTARPTYFVHGARDGAHHALRDEVRDVVAASANTRLHVAYSRPAEGDAPGRDYHSAGRVDAALLQSLLPRLDADYYLCGPAAFLADVSRGLSARGVPAERVHTESF